MADKALTHVNRSVYCALTVFLSFGFVTGEAHIRIQFCQHELVFGGVGVMTPDAVTRANGRMDVLFLEIFRIILMALQAKRVAAFRQQGNVIRGMILMTGQAFPLSNGMMRVFFLEIRLIVTGVA